MNADLLLQQATTHHEAGRLPQAKYLYDQILAGNPNHPEALHGLGLLAYQSGQYEPALQLIFRAVSLQPTNAEKLSNLGVVLAGLNRPAEALATFRRAVELSPKLTFALVNLGNALNSAGRPHDAIAAYRRAMAVEPSNISAMHGLGNALGRAGDLQGAINAYAVATRLRPDLAEPFTNLGDALTEADRLPEAIDASRRSIALNPNAAQPHNNLGRAYLKGRKIPEAIEEFRRALALNPNLFEAHNNLGSVLKDIGELDEAIVCFDRALALRPDHYAVASNRLYTLCFHPAYAAANILEEQKRWNETYVGPQRSRVQPHANDRSPDRRLKIGYVSPDFRDHVVGRNILPLLREHDRNNFEIFCYSNNVGDEPLTHRMQACADQWRRITGPTDDEAAEIVRRDGIDILVDLSLHMARNRLLLFARKPAPIQVTFGGYPGGTGVETIDYRLTDPHLDPPEYEMFYVEQSIRLPDSFWCYDVEGMSLDTSPLVNLLPALTRGHVTFGCLNNLCKINADVLNLWEKVLDAVSRSRLMVLTPPGEHRQRLSDRLAGRVDFAGWLPRQKYLEGYHHIDLGLDTFPYNGHTTSLDSLWMGVPVVTLIGQTAVGRAGWSQLSNLNLTDLAARTPDQFISIATSLAADLPRLAELRSTMRDRMRSSPLMDAPRFARNIESAYRRMWHRWSRS